MLIGICDLLFEQRALSITERKSSNGLESRQVTIIIHNCKPRLQLGKNIRKQQILKRHCRIERLKVGVIRYDKRPFMQMPIIS